MKLKASKFFTYAILSVSAVLACQNCALALPDFQTFGVAACGPVRYAATKAAVPPGALLKIKVITAAKGELGVFLWDCEKNKPLNGATASNLGVPGTPAQVWQAQNFYGWTTRPDYHRTMGKVTAGQVLTFKSRPYNETYHAGGAIDTRPCGLAILSSQNFVNGKMANVTECQQEGSVFHIKIDDGWQLDVKVQGEDF